jgi:hypothetical protein
MQRVLLWVHLACFILTGCQSGHSPMVGMSPVQQDALQVRDIDAPMSRAFSAAANALVNAGYTISITDGDGGLLVAWRREDPSAARQVATVTLTALLSFGTAPMLAESYHYSACVQVLPRPNGLASVRICLYGHGDLKAEEAIIDDLWIQMQREVLASSSR